MPMTMRGVSRDEMSESDGNGMAKKWQRNGKEMAKKWQRNGKAREQLDDTYLGSVR
jgi:hypothetical protein